MALKVTIRKAVSSRLANVSGGNMLVRFGGVKAIVISRMLTKMNKG
jgi:hypothetical protein